MAELRGILRALFEPGRFDIFNDSSYGVRTVTRLLTEDLPRPLPLLKNGDLLWRLAVALRSRPPDSVRIQHVKGHASAEDVAAGRTTAAHRLGNQAADQAAGRALAQHAGFEDFLKGAQGKLRLTWGVQQMFLAIAEAVGFDRSAPAGPVTVVPVAEEIAPEPFDVEYWLKSLPYCVFTDVLYLYFNGLEWPLGPGRGQLAVTFLELMLDAIASVRLGIVLLRLQVRILVRPLYVSSFAFSRTLHVSSASSVGSPCGMGGKQRAGLAMSAWVRWLGLPLVRGFNVLKWSFDGCNSLRGLARARNRVWISRCPLCFRLQLSALQFAGARQRLRLRLAPEFAEACCSPSSENLPARDD
eukprot:s4114_g4.t1